MFYIIKCGSASEPLNLGRIQNLDVIIFEVRPRWNNPYQALEANGGNSVVHEDIGGTCGTSINKQI